MLIYSRLLRPLPLAVWLLLVAVLLPTVHGRQESSRHSHQHSVDSEKSPPSKPSRRGDGGEGGSEQRKTPGAEPKTEEHTSVDKSGEVEKCAELYERIHDKLKTVQRKGTPSLLQGEKLQRVQEIVARLKRKRRALMRKLRANGWDFFDGVPIKPDKPATEKASGGEEQRKTPGTEPKTEGHASVDKSGEMEKWAELYERIHAKLETVHRKGTSHLLQRFQEIMKRKQRTLMRKLRAGGWGFVDGVPIKPAKPAAEKASGGEEQQTQSGVAQTPSDKTYFVQEGHTAFDKGRRMVREWNGWGDTVRSAEKEKYYWA